MSAPKHIRNDVWSDEARRIEDGENPALECALRAWFEASRLGDRRATMQFARMARHSNVENKGIPLYNIGAAYASGKKGEPDMKTAAEYYERAAKHGNARAAATLGIMILTGEIDGTKEQSIAWLNEADEGGYATWEALDYAGVEDPREELGRVRT